MSQVQKKLKISELSQDEDIDVTETPSQGPFSQDFPQMFQEIMDNLKNLKPTKKAEDFDAESVEISRSSNPEKKLMAIFNDKDGKKIKTTHFGQRGASDYTKHGDKERMGRYNTRHKSNENWNDPLSAGALSKWILWNKPGLNSSFSDYKRKFGLKGEIKVSKSAEDWEDIGWETHEPSIDPSPFETVEWEKLPLPPPKIGLLCRVLENAGYSCLIVGGAVRDVLLGLEPKDFDLATDATPDEIKEVIDSIPLDGYRYVLGPQAEKSLVNLTSLVTVPNEKEAIEITTFRKELGYAGDRTKGEFIPAKTFEEDAQRRDLTINAMGMTKDGILIDPMNGREDLENKVIRAVGDPNQRFVEDPLRMIRAIRFSTKYGMPIDPATYQGIIDNVDLIPTLSPPRLRQEIGKVLVEPNGFQMLMVTGILPILMPEFRNMQDYHHKLDYHPEDTLYNHYIEAFKKYTTIENRSELGAWALLFHDIAKPQTADWNEEGGYHTFYGHDKQGAQLVLDNYNNEVGPFEFSKKELQEIAWTTDHHLGKFWDMKKPMKVSAMRNDERFPRLVEVVTGDTMGIRRGGDAELQRRLKEINEITNKVNEQKAKTGNRPKDFARKVIQALNVKGQEISMALTEIEEMVSTGQVQSYDEALEVLKTKRNA